MYLINFIKALLPRIDKDRLLEDVRVTSSEIDQIAIPSYTQAGEYFRTAKFKSEEAERMSNVFYRNFDLQHTSKQPNFVAEVARRLPYLKENLTYIDAQIEELMGRDIINEGLTAKKAILVRAAECISFVSRYSSDLLNYVYVSEAIQANAEVEESLKLSPAAIKHVELHITKFARLVSDYGIPNKDFSKILLAVPDVIVNSKTANSIVGIYKEQDIDPFSSGILSGFTGNPIYHIRLNISEWQTSRYKANKDKKKMLELRLLHLRLLQEKKNDPKLENEITYIQGRVDKIDRYLREVEESLDIGE